MVARAEIDMLDIKAEFLKMYGKTLHSFIKVGHSCFIQNIWLNALFESHLQHITNTLTQYLRDEAEPDF